MKAPVEAVNSLQVTRDTEGSIVLPRVPNSDISVMTSGEDVLFYLKHRTLSLYKHVLQRVALKSTLK